MKKRKNGGFSLLELIVVIAILAVMGGILVGTVGNIGHYKVKQYTEILDSFMRKTRSNAMAKNNICGFCLYQKNGRYYVESYGENKNDEATIVYNTVEVKELGNSSGVEISIAKKDGSDKKVLADNTGDSVDSCIRVKYVTGTGAIDKITIDTNTDLDMDYTRITISKGENSQCIEINPVTGRHSQN